MSCDEFKNGVPGDVLVKVFENGAMIIEQSFSEVCGRARITATTLDAAVRLAVDNLALKCDFFQKMSSDEAIAIRLAEAACGSKWKHNHPIHLEQIKQAFPQYNATFDKI